MVNNSFVVFRKYASVIEAGLAKAKLDAYGIPCFLSNEHMANLYPLTLAPLVEINLYVFAKDVDRTNEILAEKE